MATKARNTIVRQVAPNSAIADLTNFVSSACTWNQGDILFYDTATNLVKPVASDANGATCMGVAVNTVISGKPAPVYQGTAVDAAVSAQSLAGPVFGCEVKLKLKTGDSFTPGAAIYATSVDAQTVSVSGTNAIGFYVGPAVTGAGADGICRIGNRLLEGTVQI